MPPLLLSPDATLPVPPMVRNAPTALMKGLGYGGGYAYNPDYMCVLPPPLLLCRADAGGRHPVTNEYLPPSLQNEVFLRPEGDTTDKIWDEEMLKRWEERKNGGQPWPGRENFTD